MTGTSPERNHSADSDEARRDVFRLADQVRLLEGKTAVLAGKPCAKSAAADLRAAAARLVTIAATLDAQLGRLGHGQLQAQVRAALAERPGLPLGVVDLAHILDRSPGAVLNCLEKLAHDPESGVDLVQVKPKRYTFGGPP